MITQKKGTRMLPDEEQFWESQPTRIVCEIVNGEYLVGVSDNITIRVSPDGVCK